MHTPSLDAPANVAYISRFIKLFANFLRLNLLSLNVLFMFAGTKCKQNEKVRISQGTQKNIC